VSDDRIEPLERENAPRKPERIDEREPTDAEALENGSASPPSRSPAARRATEMTVPTSAPSIRTTIASNRTTRLAVDSLFAAVDRRLDALA
jgi:hypothetical protein